MVRDYRIVSGANKAIVQVEVCKLLKQGWTLQGGISFIPETAQSKMWYAQAMILEDST